MNVAINGLGRIGKQFLIAALERKVNWKFFINDISDPSFILYSLKYDSVHPSLLKEINFSNGFLNIGNTNIKVTHESNPTRSPWKKENIDLVVECTGLFTKRIDAEKHLIAGARKVLISAPAKDQDSTIVCSVNDSVLKENHKIVSAGSCTTNCVSPMIKILHDTFHIKSAFFVTTHAYTVTQRIIDGFDKKDYRRGRAAAENIIPTTSGAAISVVESIPELNGKINGYALRVPVADGSIATVVAIVNKKTSVEEINSILKKKAEANSDILAYTEDPIVSSDVIHTPYSCIFDGNLTQVVSNHVSISGWYDNEWGYANRLVDVAKLMLKR